MYIRFYGSSFIADATGAKVAEAAEEGDAVLTATFDLEAMAQLRDNWFVFRDRRPDLYGPIVSLGRATRSALIVSLKPGAECYRVGVGLLASTRRSLTDPR